MSIELTPVKEKFILHWGEMGTQWGVNRTVAQIHALLYLSDRPLHAEQIANTLVVARSNVSNSIKELQSWGIIRTTHVLGDRRDHFESLTDVWEMFRIILEERKRREIDPTMRVLADCLDEAEQSGQEDEVALERIRHMLEFITTLDAWYRHLRQLPQQSLIRFVKLGSRIPQWLRGSR